MSLASFVTSCSLLPQGQTEVVQPTDAGQRIPLRHVAQLDFGRAASFAVCTEPVCPTVTRKTLVTDSAGLAVRSTVDTTATLHPSGVKPAIQRDSTDFNAVPSEAQRPPLILYFPFGGAALTASDKAALDEILPHARKAERIVIAGRADNVGSDTANQAVALARANTVRDYLRAKLPTRGDALVVDAQGSCCFIASNDTPEGRKQNRRVEIVLSVPEQVAP